MSSIVFDLDGTLIHSLPDIHAAANTVLAGADVAPLSEAEARSFIGNGASVFVEKMIAARGLGATDQGQYLAAFLGLYEDAVTLTTLYPGVEDALDRLAGLGFALGVCTNKPIGPTRAVLAHFGLTDRFGAVFGGDSFAEHKPHARPLLETYKALGEEAVLYVGDSEVDAQTAVAAEVPFALYTEGYRATPVAELPHVLAFDDYADLTAFITR